MPKILMKPHDLYIGDIRVPDFMRRKYGNRYVDDPVFLQIFKWWNTEATDKIVNLALQTTYPILPLKELALSILEQEKDAVTMSPHFCRRS